MRSSSNMHNFALWERRLSKHKRHGGRCEAMGLPCLVEKVRNDAYLAYTGNPHPSTLKGGSQ